MRAPEQTCVLTSQRYAIFCNGVRGKDVSDIRALWREDSVGFLIGSSLTFDDALERAGVPRSEEVWVLNTDLPTVRAGRFRGSLVVTMALDDTEPSDNCHTADEPVSFKSWGADTRWRSGCNWRRSDKSPRRRLFA